MMFLSLFAALPLVLPGYIGTHAYGDSPFLFQRLFEIDRNVREGVWFSRWAPDFAYGYGYPFFNFYAHLSYYVAELFVLLGSGFIWALKLTQLLFLFGSGLTMYIFTRELWAKDFAALAAVAYVYTPFHFANVYLRGDSLSELAAYALYPAILWAFYRLVKTGNILYVAVGSAFYAALALTHNISSLIFSPVIVAFACFALVWDIWQRRGQRDYLHLARTAGLILLSVLLGLGLSAFFWIPALGERQFVYLEHVTQGYFDFHNHFLDFARLVQWHPIYDYRFADPGAAGLPFQLGLVQVLLAFAGLAAALTGRIPQTGPVQGRAALVDSPLYPWETDTMRATSDTPSHIRKSQRAYLYFFAALALATGFLLLPSSAFVWERVPLMSMIQFPWRLLSLVGIGTSLLAASTLGLAGDRRRLRVAVFWAVATLTIAASTVALTPERWDIGEEDINRARVMEYEYLTSSIGTTTTYEYLPKWAKERPWTSAYLLDYPDVRDLPPVSSKGGEIHSIESRVNLKRVRVRTDKEDEITFRTLYFPGWRATLDGRDVPLRPADPSGLISVNVPAGEYEVTVFLGQTDLQAGAGRVSTGALLLLLALVVIALVRRRSWSTGITLGKGGVPLWQVAVLVVVISPLLVLMAWNLDALILGKPKPPGLETLSADVHSPFAHRHSSGIVLGDALTFVGYTWSSPRAKVGETVTLETYWRPHRELSSDLRITARLVSPAESLFARDRTYAAQTSTPLLARPVTWP
ncbi:MAG: hypothetical protein HY675_11055 [Chloroflexi bacterium]|nr:hypothetical protein [Chloroflexota bacterium]